MAPTRPRRPLLWATAAVCAGSGLGASGELSPVVARVLILSIPIAWIGASKLRVAGDPVARFALLALLLAIAALRAGHEAGLEDRLLPGNLTGTWSATGSSAERDRGNLGRGSPNCTVACGSLAAGEEVALLPVEEPAPWARGPEPGPAIESGLSHPPGELEPDSIVRLAGSRPGPVDLCAAPLEDLRTRLLARVSHLGQPLTRGLVAGLLFGDLSQLPRGIADLFVRTGTFHILAISGLQVALVAVLLAGPLARLLALLVRGLAAGRLRPRPETLRAALLLLFVPLAGYGPPVTRSALTWMLGALAPTLRVRRLFVPPATGAPGEPPRRALWMPRASDPLSLWSLALLAECLVHPDAPLSLSVQLSYAATLGLILATGSIVAKLRSVLPATGRISEVGSTGRPRHAAARVVAQRLVDVSLYAIAASLAAVLATSPFVWTRFGEWSPAGILATPAIGLPVAWLLVIGWVWLLAPAAVPEVLLDLPSQGMTSMLEAFDRLPGSPCPLPPRPFVLLVLAVGLSFLAISRVHGQNHNRARAWIARAAALASALALVPWNLAPAALEIHALDVGSGTAALLRAPGGAVWIFDAGSRDRPEVDREALGPLLRAWEVSRVGVILSHPDRDHDGALGWLLERYPPRVWAGALPAHLAERLPHTTLRIDVAQGRVKMPELEPGGRALEMELARGLDTEGNEGSRSLEIVWGGERIVLCGDAEAEGLAAWLRDRPSRGPARMLLFPHHGSDTDYLGPLLDSVRPAEIWISASGTPGVARELDRRGLAWRSTARCGPLLLGLP